MSVYQINPLPYPHQLLTINLFFFFFFLFSQIWPKGKILSKILNTRKFYENQWLGVKDLIRFPPRRSQSWLNSAGGQRCVGKSPCVQSHHCHGACCLLEGWEGLERQLGGVPGGALLGMWQHFRDERRRRREAAGDVGRVGVLVRECFQFSFISQSDWVSRWSSREQKRTEQKRNAKPALKKWSPPFCH